MNCDVQQQLDMMLRQLRELAAELKKPERRFLSIATAAAYADVSKESVRRLVNSGKLKAFRPVRGKVLIDRRELEAYVLGSTTRPRIGRGRKR